MSGLLTEIDGKIFHGKWWRETEWSSEVRGWEFGYLYVEEKREGGLQGRRHKSKG